MSMSVNWLKHAHKSGSAPWVRVAWERAVSARRHIASQSASCRDCALPSDAYPGSRRLQCSYYGGCRVHQIGKRVERGRGNGACEDEMCEGGNARMLPHISFTYQLDLAGYEHGTFPRYDLMISISLNILKINLQGGRLINE